MKYLLLIFVSLLLSMPSFAQEVKVEKCRSEVKGGRYKLYSASYGMRGERPLLLIIVVNQRRINREDMIQLARRLKSEYCHEEKLMTVIYDNRKYINHNYFVDFLNSGGKKNWARGYYSFDRATGKDLIEFSSKLGNPTDENKINLSAEN